MDYIKLGALAILAFYVLVWAMFFGAGGFAALVDWLKGRDD